MVSKKNHSIRLVHIIYGNYIVYHPLEGCDEITRGEKYNHLGDGPQNTEISNGELESKRVPIVYSIHRIVSNSSRIL
jgi:hypothetical protein